MHFRTWAATCCKAGPVAFTNWLISTRKAVTYDAAVIAVAGIAFAIYATTDRASLVLTSSVPAILLIGGIGAFVKTYQVRRAGGTWRCGRERGGSCSC
jgi:hypothetical protein